MVGDAFEVFAESKLVGEKGEFFTPREIVKMAIQIINPQPEQSIIDPACGSGGFLIYAVEHVWRKMEIHRKYKDIDDLTGEKKRIAEKYFVGIDKESDLVKIAKAYMAIIGDGRGGIVQQNSLHTAEDFNGRARELIIDKESEDFVKFDIVLTNPPFGSKIKVLMEDSKYFDLGHKWRRVKDNWQMTDLPKETEPQILFIERCLKLLKKGGKLAIILPETYFHAPNASYVLEYIKHNNNIIALIDLAHNSFRPHNNAKCILLILQKGEKQNSKIIMGVTEEIGHDHNGSLIYRYDEENKIFTDQIWDDTEVIRKELNDIYNPSNKNIFFVDVKDIKNNVFVPRYYWGKRTDEIKKEADKKNLELIQLKDLIKEQIIKDYSGHGSPPAKYKGKGEIPYVRVADIVNWEVYKNSTSLIPEDIYLKKKGNGIDLQEKDILYVRRGSYRIGSVALVSKFDLKVLLTKEIHVFRVVNELNDFNINPYYLLYLFSHELTQRQLYNKVMIDTTLPNIGRRWEEIYLPIAKSRDERILIGEKIEKAFIKRWDAQNDIYSIMDEFGNLVQ